MAMSTETLKVETEAEACCVCGAADELCSPEEHDAGAPRDRPPLRAVLLHLNRGKSVPSGRLCVRCAERAHDAYGFSTALAARDQPPLGDKIRALRKRLHELTQKIDVFIVVGGGSAGAGGAYSEQDIIMVEREALGAAARADCEPPPRARSLRGDHCYQCTVCPLTFQRAAEFRAHLESHGSGAAHACWSCGAQFASHAAARAHAADHAADHLQCQLCHTTFQSAWSLRAHEASAACPSRCPECGATFPSRGALRAHAAAHARVCGACLRVLPGAAARAAHALEHARHNHFLCGYDGCILRFATRANLVSHLRKCHGSERAPPAPAPAPAPVPCASCDRTFGSVAAMKRHARVHTKPPRESMEWSAGAGGGEAAEEEGRVEYLEVEALDDTEEH